MDKESKYYGVHACLAVWKERPKDIIRVYAHPGKIKAVSSLLKWCAKEKKAYHILEDNELEKLTDSVHHEGICLLAKDPPHPTLQKCFSEDLLLFLAGVGNPHNVGSILRTCAHFGIHYLLGDIRLTPSAKRVAIGGAEKVGVITTHSPIDTLQKLKAKGFSLIAASSDTGTSLYSFSFPKQSVLLLGSESDGLTPDILSLTTHRITIPGTKKVESLNVSVAAALFLGEHFRQKGGI